MQLSSICTFGRYEGTNFAILQKLQGLYETIFEPGMQPTEFISMDLFGEFHPPLSKGNRYALTAVCMLMGYTFHIPLKTKQQKKSSQSGKIT